MKKTLLFVLAIFTLALNAQTKLLSAVYESYNGSTYTNSGGFNYEYDGNNRLVKENSLNWNGSNFENSYETSYTYNANNKLTQSIEKQWNSANAVFVNSYREIITYDGSGKIIENVSQDWNGSQWVDAYKVEITYTGNNFDIVYFYEWNGSQWIRDGRSNATYNANNKLSEFLNYDGGNPNYVLSDRDLLTYNTNNQVLTEITETWDNNAWTEDSRNTFEFDGTGNLTVKTENWEATNQYRYEYTYDTAAQMSSFAHPFTDKSGIDYVFESFPYVNKVLTEIEYRYDTPTTYSLRGRTTYNYNNLITLSSQNIANKPIALYPNPASNHIEISGINQNQKFTVYSVTGIKAMEGLAKANEKLEINSLANGLYLLKLEQGNTIKFIKE